MRRRRDGSHRHKQPPLRHIAHMEYINKFQWLITARSRVQTVDRARDRSQRSSQPTTSTTTRGTPLFKSLARMLSARMHTHTHRARRRFICARTHAQHCARLECARTPHMAKIGVGRGGQPASHPQPKNLADRTARRAGERAAALGAPARNKASHTQAQIPRADNARKRRGKCGRCI